MLPKVVIVGRPNVGKSSLLNLLSGRLISIVDATAGVTRDRVSTVVELAPPPGEEQVPDPKAFELIDTGGYGFREETADRFSGAVERQISLALETADLILFVVDAQSGIMPLDQEVARLLRASVQAKHPGTKLTDHVLLVANKVDAESFEAAASEAHRLGFGAPLPVSATTGNNKSTLMREVVSRLDFSKVPNDAASGPLFAIVGKRNAGKSTLVNALAGAERVIVSPIEGTTRDSIDVRFEMDGKVFTAIDTAGVRKRKSMADDIEYYSYHRALRSIRRADVVIFLIDATLPLSQVDEQLGTEIMRHFKPTVVVINKWDLAQAEHDEDEFTAYLEKELPGLGYAPLAFISAANGQGMRTLVDVAMNLYKQAGTRVGTSELNRIVEQVVDEHPPSSKQGKRLKIYYVTQLEIRPPTIGLWVNDPSQFDPTYQRYLLNRFREVLPFPEVPINLVVRGKKAMPEAGNSVKNPTVDPGKRVARTPTRGQKKKTGKR